MPHRCTSFSNACSEWVAAVRDSLQTFDRVVLLCSVQLPGSARSSIYKQSYLQSLTAQMLMLKSILAGQAPSRVFRQVFLSEPAMDNYRLAEMLADQYVRLSGEAVQLVWHWRSPSRKQGLSDENLDAILVPLFLEAGYVIEGKS